jgi:cytochrome c oxidase assembly factor CtaG
MLLTNNNRNLSVFRITAIWSSDSLYLDLLILLGLFIIELNARSAVQDRDSQQSSQVPHVACCQFVDSKPTST